MEHPAPADRRVMLPNDGREYTDAIAQACVRYVLSASTEMVRLYLQETLTLLPLTSEAAMVPEMTDKKI
jgi:hypothetical protein